MALSTESLLRPQQIDNLKMEQSQLQSSLNNPGIQDKGTVVRQLRKVESQIQNQSPKPPVGIEKDNLERQAKKLKKDILEGMPSHEEMRKCPPGSIGKNRTWEKRCKNKLLKWKNAMLRLNIGSDDPDVANFEKHRPRKSSLNMDNAIIPGKHYFLPSEDPEYGDKHDKIFSKENKKE